MSPSDDSTRPISVAELLARNGTIGAPPVSGRRHRRRGNDQSVTVAELTGEIPVIRATEVPVASEATEEPVYEEPVYEEPVAEEPVAEEPVAEEPVYAEPASAETVVIYTDDSIYTDYTDYTDYTEPASVAGSPPLSSAPLPSRERGLELSHDPRPQRRSSGAEQMTCDPVDQSVDLV
ncbi:MAG: hypothetical protein QNL98_14690, partial [Mycobacterium sp.]